MFHVLFVYHVIKNQIPSCLRYMSKRRRIKRSHRDQEVGVLMPTLHAKRRTVCRDQAVPFWWSLSLFLSSHDLSSPFHLWSGDGTIENKERGNRRTVRQALLIASPKPP